MDTHLRRGRGRLSGRGRKSIPRTQPLSLGGAARNEDITALIQSPCPPRHGRLRTQLLEAKNEKDVQAEEITHQNHHIEPSVELESNYNIEENNQIEANVEVDDHDQVEEEEDHQNNIELSVQVEQKAHVEPKEQTAGTGWGISWLRRPRMTQPPAVAPATTLNSSPRIPSLPPTTRPDARPRRSARRSTPRSASPRSPTKRSAPRSASPREHTQKRRNVERKIRNDEVDPDFLEQVIRNTVAEYGNHAPRIIEAFTARMDAMSVRIGRNMEHGFETVMDNTERLQLASNRASEVSHSRTWRQLGAIKENMDEMVVIQTGTGKEVDRVVTATGQVRDRLENMSISMAQRMGQGEQRADDRQVTVMHQINHSQTAMTAQIVSTGSGLSTQIANLGQQHTQTQNAVSTQIANLGQQSAQIETAISTKMANLGQQNAQIQSSMFSNQNTVRTQVAVIQQQNAQTQSSMSSNQNALCAQMTNFQQQTQNSVGDLQTRLQQLQDAVSQIAMKLHDPGQNPDNIVQLNVANERCINLESELSTAQSKLRSAQRDSTKAANASNELIRQAAEDHVVDVSQQLEGVRAERDQLNKECVRMHVDQEQERVQMRAAHASQINEMQTEHFNDVAQIIATGKTAVERERNSSSMQRSIVQQQNQLEANARREAEAHFTDQLEQARQDVQLARQSEVAGASALERQRNSSRMHVDQEKECVQMRAAHTSQVNEMRTEHFNDVAQIIATGKNAVEREQNSSSMQRSIVQQQNQLEANARREAEAHFTAQLDLARQDAQLARQSEVVGASALEHQRNSSLIQHTIASQHERTFSLHLHQLLLETSSPPSVSTYLDLALHASLVRPQLSNDVQLALNQQHIPTFSQPNALEPGSALPYLDLATMASSHRGQTSLSAQNAILEQDNAQKVANAAKDDKWRVIREKISARKALGQGLRLEAGESDARTRAERDAETQAQMQTTHLAYSSQITAAQEGILSAVSAARVAGEREDLARAVLQRDAVVEVERGQLQGMDRGIWGILGWTRRYFGTDAEGGGGDGETAEEVLRRVERSAGGLVGWTEQVDGAGEDHSDSDSDNDSGEEE